MAESDAVPTPLLSLRTIEKRYDIPQGTIRKMIARGEIGYAKKEPGKKQTMVRVPEQEINRVFTFFPALTDIDPK